jgi:uncharacterized protein YkwD
MKKLMFISILAVSFSVQAQSQFEKAIVIEINKFRVENGLDTLVWSNNLYRASSHHAKWMSLAEQSSHEETFSVGKLKTLKLIDDRFAEYQCRGFNENLAISPEPTNLAEDARRIVSCWKRSPGHRQNLLFNRASIYSAYDVERSVTSIAVSAKVSPKGGQLYTVMNIGVEVK